MFIKHAWLKSFPIVFSFLLVLLICLNIKAENSHDTLRLKKNYMTLCLGMLPFKDVSEFKGKWILKKDIPVYISNYLKAYYNVIEFEKLFTFIKDNSLPEKTQFTQYELKKISNEFNPNYLIFGEIEKFFIHKGVFGSGPLGGAKHYLGIIHLKIMCYASFLDSIIFTKEIKINKQWPMVRFNLFKLSEDEENYLKLNEEKFGSPLFDSTIAGDLMQTLCKNVDDELLRFLAHIPVEDRINKKKTSKIAKIISISSNDTDVVYINAGFKEDLFINEKFDIFFEKDTLYDPESGQVLGTTEDKVGELIIEIIKTEHLSRAKILKRIKNISKGCYIYIIR